jgi:integrase
MCRCTHGLGWLVVAVNVVSLWQLVSIGAMRRVRLTDSRHSRVSLLLALGLNPRVVMEIVGRSATEMTTNVYGHVTLDNQRARSTCSTSRLPT